MPSAHAQCTLPSTADSAVMQNATEDGEDVADEGADGLRLGPRPEALTVGGGPSTRPSGAFGAAGEHALPKPMRSCSLSAVYLVLGLRTP